MLEPVVYTPEQQAAVDAHKLAYDAYFAHPGDIRDPEKKQLAEKLNEAVAELIDLGILDASESWSVFAGDYRYSDDIDNSDDFHREY